jgi:hypothetical protein
LLADDLRQRAAGRDMVGLTLIGPGFVHPVKFFINNDLLAKHQLILVALYSEDEGVYKTKSFGHVDCLEE